MSPLAQSFSVILACALVGVAAALFVSRFDKPQLPKRTRADEMAELEQLHSLPSGERR